MVPRRKAARQIPNCVAAMYDQLVHKITVLNLCHGVSIFVVPSIKSILLFLCCRDKEREKAYALWDELSRLKGAGNAYEFEAAKLVADTAWYVVDYHGLTRSQLQTVDKALAKAAADLRTALIRHDDDFNDFKNESSAVNWPEEYMTNIARLLRGIAVSNDRLLAADKSHRFDKIDWPPPPREEALFWVLCHNVPTMVQMLDVLERRAKELSSSRFDAKKRRQSAGDASDTRFIRRLISGLINRNPASPADQIARIVSPIVDRVVGGTTFARCKKAAERMKRELEVDGTISPF